LAPSPHLLASPLRSDELFLEKEQIAKDVKEELTKSMTEFGYQILQALVTDIEPDAKVKGEREKKLEERLSIPDWFSRQLR
jgi:regulator of protease activity HflC (stomatin/prohibitin superfamily)